MTDVSVIIPTFNSPKSCCEAIASCLTSKRLNIEIIVVDDGGTQPAGELIEKQFGSFNKENNKSSIQLNAEQSIHYYFQENQGAYKTRLTAVNYACGQFIKFLDHDDVLIEGALNKEIEHAKLEQADIVMTDWIIRHYDDDKGLTRDEQKHAPDYQGVHCIDGILQKGCPYTSANLYKKSVFENVQPVKAWQPRLSDDWVIALQVCLNEPRYSTLPTNSYIWQHHPAQLSRNEHEGHIDEFYNVLGWFEQQLEKTGRLLDSRKETLADYYFKNAILLCQYQPDRWKNVAAHILTLNSNFKPAANKLISYLFKIVGLEKAISLYVAVKKFVLVNK